MTASGRGWSPPARVLVALAVLAPAVPLVVALLARRHPPWVPDLDLALTELRVRDVGGPHTPLIGLPGRIGTLQEQGSHPGPISFYLLAPLYRLLGSTAWALQASTVALHLSAVGVAVGLVVRRAGARWALAVGVGLTGLVAGLGPNLFTEPWNPHLPLLWWPAFLAATWSALGGDRVALPWLVLAGAVCGQTHVSYLGPVAVLTAAAVVVAVSSPDPGGRAAIKPWVAAAVVLAVTLWAPPLIDQVGHDPGNVRRLADHLLDPPDAPIGWEEGGRLVLERLDITHLAWAAAGDPGALGARYPAGASARRGVLLLSLAIAAAAARGRRAPRPERALHVLAASALVLVSLAVTRIFGVPWGYLLLLAWPVALLLVLVVAAALAATVVARGDERATHVLDRRAVPLLLAAVVVAVSGRAAVAVRDAEPTNPVVSRTVLALVPDVVDALEPGGRYLVTWTDAIHLGGHGYGMVDELERRGVEVAVSDGLATQFGPHRAVGDGPVTGRLVVASGRAIGRWTAQPGAVLLAQVDVRTPAERAASRQARADLRTTLHEHRLDDLLQHVDVNLLAVALDPRLPPSARDLVDELDRLGAPAATFLVPLDAELP